MHTRDGLRRALEQDAMFNRPPVYRHPAQQWRQITNYVYSGRGAITIGLTENGNIGVWFGDEELTAGTGDNVRQALMDAFTPDKVAKRNPTQR